MHRERMPELETSSPGVFASPPMARRSRRTQRATPLTSTRMLTRFPFATRGDHQLHKAINRHPPFQYCASSSLRTDSPDADYRCIGTLPHFGRPGVERVSLDYDYAHQDKR